MSSLTEEQRKKIEENRKRALEKRAALIKNRATQVTTQETVHCFNGNSSVVSTEKKIKLNDLPTKTKPVQSTTTFYSNHLKPPTEKTSLNETKPVFSGKKITGNLVLSSKTRFIANVPFHAQTVEIFKTIPSKQYDMISRKWSFDIADHSKLSSALNQLRPAVCVSPLPSYVLQALRKESSYTDPATIDLTSIDPLLLEAFMPFQREGVCFGVSRNGRALVADDMGLGKTVQALGIASYYRSEWPLLIVAPSSVRYCWVEAIERWFSDVHSSDITVVNSAKDSLEEGDVVIISYDLLSRRAQEFKLLNFQVVVMDESHMLKNFKSVRYKSASPLMKTAQRVILLSGTPALSRPSELYTQLSAIDKKLFPNFQDYGIRYCNGKCQRWGWDYSGSSNMEELEIVLKATLVIRRMKSDVLSQLPSKQRMSIILDPSSIKAKTTAMQALSKQLSQSNLNSGERHGALLQMFNESAFAKVKAVCDYIKELLVEGEKKFLVFAHHKVMIMRISDVCEELKVHYICIDGSTPSDARHTLVDQFQSNDNIRVAILSITAASTGITLTAAQLVIFAELYWNPGPLVQAEDRVHRIGQEDSVLIQYLVARNTADDYMWPLIQSKLNILGKAGLSKDDFGHASCTHRKSTMADGIMKYLSKLDKEIDPPTSREDKVDGGITRYFSVLKEERNDAKEECPASSSSLMKRRRSELEEEEED